MYILVYNTINPTYGYNKKTSTTIYIQTRIIMSQNNVRNKKVVCLNTKMQFNTMTKAGKYHNVSRGSISGCCLFKRKYAGVHNITKERLVWRDLDQYEKMTDSEIDTLIKNAQLVGFGEYSSTAKSVICVNTQEIFKTITDASKSYGIINSSISSCCKKLRKSAGNINGEKLLWEYYPLDNSL